MPDYKPQYVRSHALIIGIDSYSDPRFQPLGSAEDDARVLAEVLRGDPYHFEVMTLLGDQATSNAILDALESLQQTGPDDRIIVYFAGHGYTLDNIHDHPTGFMAAADTDPDRRHTGVKLEEISELRLYSPTKHITFIFDSCFSGQVLGTTRMSAASRHASSLMTRTSYQALSAATGDQAAGDVHSMTDVFVEALHNLPPGPDGLLAFNEVAAYVQQEVNRRSKGTQTPQFGQLTGSQGGDLVFYQMAEGEEFEPRPMPSMTRPQYRDDTLAEEIEERVGKVADSLGVSPLAVVISIIAVLLISGVLLTWVTGGFQFGGDDEPTATAIVTDQPTDEPTDVPTDVPTEPVDIDPTPDPTTPDLSPVGDGLVGRIIFTCYDGNFNQICLLDAASESLRQLTNTEATDFYGTLSPDGSLVAFSSNRSGQWELYVMSSNGEDVQQLTEGGGSEFSPAYSPDGARIVYTSTEDNGNDQRLWMMDADGSNARLLADLDGNQLGPVWSPDGESILFASDHENEGENQLYVIRADGSGMKRLTNNPQMGGRMDWSPDGTQITFFAGPTGSREVYLMDADGSNIEQVTSGGDNLAPAFSPNGQWIVYVSTRDGDNELFLLAVNGRTRRQLTNNIVSDYQPRWGR